mgnify:CR=1 FL=1
MWLFLSTGIRAVDHCVEGICSNEIDARIADASALHGLALLARGLPRVKADPDGHARRGSTARSARGSRWRRLAAGVPMGASHGIGYVLGAVFDVPHGHTSCIMLPSVMRWNKPANAERQALVAAAMGHPGEDAGDVLDDFIRGLGMPRSLGEVKIGARAFRPHRQAGDGHALGAAQPAADRRAGAGEGDPGAGGLGRLNSRSFRSLRYPLPARGVVARMLSCTSRNPTFRYSRYFRQRAWCWAEVSAPMA